MIPRIDVFRCDGCAVCVKHCPPQIIGMVRNKAAILIDLCEECGICAEACPMGAIHFRLPNYAIEKTHVAYRSPRDVAPSWGNWRVGVPLGRDGKGHPQKMEDP